MKKKTPTMSHQHPLPPHSRGKLLRNLKANIETLCLVMTAEVLGKPPGAVAQTALDSVIPASAAVIPALSPGVRQKSSARARR
jgi:hypothetical protein